MRAIEIARRMAELGRTAEAREAYALALRDEERTPEEMLEAAVYILQSGGNYKVSYLCLLELYKMNWRRQDVLALLDGAFYQPNAKALEKRYRKNRRLLEKYPYLFRKDFPSFADLPVRYFPYDEEGYVPFFPAEERFGDYAAVNAPVVGRNFFQDLENPILARDVTSQYELEYLNDNVRDSKRVGRENHVYLHYGDWGAFCSLLPCLNLGPLLREKKLVFLIGDETELYPIDFKARFGEDYSRCEPRPVGVREVRKLIWHTQLSSHNGGDFFNEVFDSHPNLLVLPSLILPDLEERVTLIREAVKNNRSADALQAALPWCPRHIAEELLQLRDLTDKDALAALYLGNETAAYGLDQNARIAPAVFFQPHFVSPRHEMRVDPAGRAELASGELDALRKCRFLKEFKYIKTFTPMRRPTVSYAATVRFTVLTSRFYAAQEAKDPAMKKHVVNDAVVEYTLNRSFLADPEDRLFRDSVLVRFEDAKLNPKAAFTALAAFLDIPYTESMTYCSDGPRRDPHPETKGFDAAPVYRTYDEYAGDAERYFLEYFLRDAYEYCGYDFQYWDGAPVDEKKAEELIAGFTTLNGYIRESWRKCALPEGEAAEEARRQFLDEHIARCDEQRMSVARTLLRGVSFVNEKGQPLHFIRKLEPDPALLERPLYH